MNHPFCFRGKVRFPGSERVQRCGWSGGRGKQVCQAESRHAHTAATEKIPARNEWFSSRWHRKNPTQPGAVMRA